MEICYIIYVSYAGLESTIHHIIMTMIYSAVETNILQSSAGHIIQLFATHNQYRIPSDVT